MRMFSSLLTVTIIALINALFAWKYTSRIDSDAFVLLAVLASAGSPFLVVLVYKSERFAVLHHVLNSRKTFIVLIAGSIALSLLIFKLYPQENLRIDRYEMIQLFWDNAFSLRCPYFPQSDGSNMNIPGPFPFYFYAAFPFYLTGEIGLFSLAGFLLFAGILLMTKKFSIRLKNSILLLLITSPLFIYELLCRSTNFMNSALLLFCTLLLWRTGSMGRKYLIFAGILTGLALSTRSFAFVIIAFAVIFTFKQHFFCRKVFTLSAISVVTFLLTFIPVIALCRKDFLEFNPFTVQASLAPPLLMAIVSLAAGILAYQSRNIYTLSTINGLVLLLFVAGYGSHFIAEYGFTSAILRSLIDISYLGCAMPFLLFGFDNKPGRMPENNDEVITH